MVKWVFTKADLIVEFLLMLRSLFTHNFSTDPFSALWEDQDNVEGGMEEEISIHNCVGKMYWGLTLN